MASAPARPSRARKTWGRADMGALSELRARRLNAPLSAGRAGILAPTMIVPDDTWWAEAVLWLAVAGVIAATAAALGTWALVRRLDQLAKGLRALEGLEEIRRA